MKVAPVAQLDPNRRRSAAPAHDVARTASKQAAVAAGPRVADIASTEVVQVPGWFTVTQARRVAELKRVSHVLVEDRGRVSGAVSLNVLAHAPAADTVARWTNRTDAHLDPQHPVSHAERLLRAEGTSCLPVVAGGLLVGTVTIHDVAPAHDDAPTSQAA